MDWNTNNDMPSDNSQYIRMFAQCFLYLDYIKQELNGFALRWEATREINQLPDCMDKTIWLLLSKYLFDCLVEGFASEKCSQAGRSLMFMDFRNLQAAIGIHCSYQVDVTRLNTYIAGFFEVDDTIEAWVKENKVNYTKDQLTALINSGMWDIKVKRKCLQML